MAPVLKADIPISRGGYFTDKDQALLMEMVPTRKDRPAAASPRSGISMQLSGPLGVTGPAPDRFGGQAGQPSTGAPAAES